MTGGWEQVPSTLAPGRYLMQGDEACAEGAIAAGCGFYAGYPITPATEIMEQISQRFSGLAGRVFAQMEDELASMAAVIGASWAGAKAMTATSGPGLSLMLENVAYALMTETPLVLVDVQRAGPSTGQATRPAQGDVMQARWGAGGDYEIIVLSPWSVSEMYSETIRAFNLAERFRVPVVLLSDEAVGHLREKVDVAPTVTLFNRWRAAGQSPFGDAEVPPMPAFGQGERLLVTGSTHDAWGYRRTSSAAVQGTLVQRLAAKIIHNRRDIEASELLLATPEEPLDVLLVAYGFTARGAYRAAMDLRGRGCRAAVLRLRTLWPFADEAVRAATARAKRVLVVEMNRGHILREVQRLAPLAQGYQRTDGEVVAPAEIEQAVQECNV